jgi:LPXTG-motif cell wall-anchored protein
MSPQTDQWTHLFVGVGAILLALLVVLLMFKLHEMIVGDGEE